MRQFSAQATVAPSAQCVYAQSVLWCYSFSISYISWSKSFADKLPQDSQGIGNSSTASRCSSSKSAVRRRNLLICLTSILLRMATAIRRFLSCLATPRAMRLSSSANNCSAKQPAKFTLSHVRLWYRVDNRPSLGHYRGRRCRLDQLAGQAIEQQRCELPRAAPLAPFLLGSSLLPCVAQFLVKLAVRIPHAGLMDFCHLLHRLEVGHIGAHIGFVVRGKSAPDCHEVGTIIVIILIRHDAATPAGRTGAASRLIVILLVVAFFMLERAS